MTSKKSFHNWIHLDFKGMIPSEKKLVQWLTWLRAGGFEGVVFEYEDRLPWESLPGAFRPGWEVAAWRRIWGHCAALGLEVIPLIQTYGHLEWLLRHDRWAALRCGGHLNVLCPQHPETRPLLAAWIAEAARLHPQSRYLHVGLDEVYHLGACPACQASGEAVSRGDAGILLAHALFVCAEVQKAGKQPILWADLFTDEAVLAALPKEAVVCDWDYRPPADGFPGRPGRLKYPLRRRVMGASAIRCSFNPWQLVGDVDARVRNVRAWHRSAAEEGEALIHTVWGRSRSLAPIYGPWEGWLPAFQVAGEPSASLSPAVQEGMACLQAGGSADYHRAAAAARQMESLRSDDPWEEAALRWWELSLRHHLETLALQYQTVGFEALRAKFARGGPDANIIAEFEGGRQALLSGLGTLENEVARWLSANEWSDTEEYLESRFGSLRRVLAATRNVPAFP